MDNYSFTAELLKELQYESVSTRKCLERIDAQYFDFKPHPTSMHMKYLALLVAEIPLWIVYMIKDGEIDLATFEHKDFSNGAELAANFDQNIKAAEEILSKTKDEDLESDFSLRNKGEILYTAKKRDDLTTTINHWVHHRGQLTVYMRICEIPVPSIYGPSADDRSF